MRKLFSGLLLVVTSFICCVGIAKADVCPGGSQFDINGNYLCGAIDITDLSLDYYVNYDFSYKDGYILVKINSIEDDGNIMNVDISNKKIELSLDSAWGGLVSATNGSINGYIYSNELEGYGFLFGSYGYLGNTYSFDQIDYYLYPELENNGTKLTYDEVLDLTLAYSIKGFKIITSGMSDEIDESGAIKIELENVGSTDYIEEDTVTENDSAVEETIDSNVVEETTSSNGFIPYNCLVYTCILLGVVVVVLAIVIVIKNKKINKQL